MSDICFLGMKVTPTGHIRLISYCRVWNLDAFELVPNTSAFTIWPIRQKLVANEGFEPPIFACKVAVMAATRKEYEVTLGDCQDVSFDNHCAVISSL
jgi:hypothetical protein